MKTYKIFQKENHVDQKEQGSCLFVFCACLSVTLLIISNIAATKLWDFFGLTVLDGGILTFPLAFVLSDVILEIWGERRAKFVVWCGFFMNLVAVATLFLVQILPAGTEWNGQGAYEQILGFLPRVVAGSLMSYLVSQFLNVLVFIKIRAQTGKKWLWARSLGSSAIANLSNSLVFCGIVFSGIVSIDEWWSMVGVSCGLMIVCEILLTPVNYWVVKQMRRLTT